MQSDIYITYLFLLWQQNRKTFGQKYNTNGRQTRFYISSGQPNVLAVNKNGPFQSTQTKVMGS